MGRIIISRKGFDSENGGMASAFIPGERMVSFPIPSTDPADQVRYSCISAEGMSLEERIKQLRWNYRTPFNSVRCHHDPDLVQDSRARLSLDGWRGIFGQSGDAQDDLDREKVSAGDLFLFFGWFKQAENGANGLRFCRKAPDWHVFFGYLEIGEVFLFPANHELPGKYKCFADHPHLRPERQRKGKAAKNNTVYIAAESLSLDPQFSGWGVFRYPRNSRNLVLTKEGSTRAFWSLPDFFRERKIGRLRKDAWLRPDGAFRSPDIGQQEIIMDADDKLREWALGIIRAGMGVD